MEPRYFEVSRDRKKIRHIIVTLSYRGNLKYMNERSRLKEKFEIYKTGIRDT